MPRLAFLLTFIPHSARALPVMYTMSNLNNHHPHSRLTYVETIHAGGVIPSGSFASYKLMKHVRFAVASLTTCVVLVSFKRIAGVKRGGPGS